MADTQRTAKAVYGTPKIDGEIDAVWDKAEKINVNNFVVAWQGATSNVSLMWDEDYLYILYAVKDLALNADSADIIGQDSVEAFVKDGDITHVYRVGHKNAAEYGDGGAPDSTFVSAVKLVSGGYVVEMAIPLQDSAAKNGTVVSFDAQVNDADEAGCRVSIARWNDVTDNTPDNQDYSYGILTLTGK